MSQPAGVLSGQVAIVTGSGSGIGKAIALQLGQAGARVVLVGRDSKKLEATAREMKPAQTLIVAADVSSNAAAEEIVAQTIRTFGELQILINNAGIARWGTMADATPEEIDRIVDINLKGPMFLSRAALPYLRKHKDRDGSSIVNISTGASLIAVKNFTVYCASKAGLNHLTRCMALDFGPEKIRVNAIAPGAVDTPIFESMMPATEARGLLQQLAPMHPLGRIGTPEDIAAATVFLCTPQAAWITGAILPVDGGLSLG